MGYAVKRSYQINQRLRRFLDENDKKPSALADKAALLPFVLMEDTSGDFTKALIRAC